MPIYLGPSWAEHLKNMAVVGRATGKFGIVSLCSHRSVMQYRERSPNGFRVFSPVFLEWSKRESSVEVVLRKTFPGRHFVFVATFSDSSVERLRIGNDNFFQCSTWKGVVCQGGYILDEHSRQYLPDSLAWEISGTENAKCFNRDRILLRYPRDPKLLLRPSDSIEPPVGKRVVVVELSNCQGGYHSSLVFGEDEEPVSFERLKVRDIIGSPFAPSARIV